MIKKSKFSKLSTVANCWAMSKSIYCFATVAQLKLPFIVFLGIIQLRFFGGNLSLVVTIGVSSLAARFVFYMFSANSITQNVLYKSLTSLAFYLMSLCSNALVFRAQCLKLRLVSWPACLLTEGKEPLNISSKCNWLKSATGRGRFRSWLYVQAWPTS